MKIPNIKTKISNNLYKFNITPILILVSFVNIYLTLTIEEVYKSILVQNYNIIFIFTNDNIYSYDSITLSKKKNFQFQNENQQIENSYDIETISIAPTTKQSNADCNKIYIIVKTYLYFCLYDGSIYRSIPLTNFNSAPTNLIIQEFSDSGGAPIWYFLITNINANKKLEIRRWKHIIPDDSYSQIMQITYSLINSSGESSENLIDYISCQIMRDSNENVLTCFYVNINNEIGTVHFSPADISEKNISPKFRTIKSAIIIKSVLYSDNSKALVCYISNDGDCFCLSFDIIKNEWSNCEIKYLQNCIQQNNFFSFDYYENKNEYILSCFTSRTKFSAVSFNSSMILLNITDDNYCLSNEEITSCEGNPFASVINYDDEFEIDIYCSDLDTSANLFQKDFTRTCSTTSKLSYIDSDNYSSNNINQNFDIITTIINNPEIQPTILSTPSDKKEYDNKTDSITNYINNNIIIKEDVETSSISKLDVDNSDMVIKKRINKSMEDLVNNLDDLMKDVELGKVYEMKADDYEVKISPINYNEYEDSSTYINFKECENSLRKKNNLPKDSILTVIQIEIYKYEEKALTNQVEYAVYNDKRIKLDLSACEKDKIEINYAITNSSILDLDKLSEFSNMNVDILDIKDHFFTDICYPFSENNSDMTLKDRRSNIYQNYSLCDNNCEYDRINISSMIISCNCEIKKDIDTKKPPLKFEKIYVDLFSESTFGVSKCFNLVFDFKNKSKNIGFIIFTILVSLHIPILIYYIIVGIEPISKYIINEMEKNNYTPKLNYPNKKSKKNFNKILNLKTEILNLKKNYKNSRPQLKRKKNSKLSSQEQMSSSCKNIINYLKDIDKKNIKDKSSKADKVFQPIVIFNYPKTNKNIFKFNDKTNIKATVNLKTNNISLNNKNQNKLEKDLKNKSNYYLIKIDATNSLNYISCQSKYYLDNFEYEDAIIYDKRSFWRIYLICLFSKENILSTFFLNCPMELKSMRYILFIFVYSCDLALNTIFFFNNKISDKYYYKGHSLFWFNLLNNLTISFISFLISFIVVIFLQLLTSSRDDFENIFKEEEKKLKNNKNYKVGHKNKLKIAENIIKINNHLRYKITAFIMIEIIMMFFFYYFVTAFCEVYKETQLSWLIDCFISFMISFPVELVLSLFICILYLISIKKRIKILYKISIFLYNIG